MSNLKEFVNTKRMHDAFMDYLDAKIQIKHNALALSSDEKEIFRLQGEIRCMRNMKSIRAEINDPEVDDGQST